MPVNPVTTVDLSTYVRVGRYDLPEPTRTTAPTNSLLGQATSTDYAPTLTGVATIASGQFFVDITITPIDDTLAEGSETVPLTLGDTVRYDTGTPKTATVTITDNDSTVDFSTGSYSVTEGNTAGFSNSATVRITRQGDLSNTSTVQLLLSDGTAKGSAAAPTVDTTKGLSSSATPYIIPTTPGSGVSVKSILTVGDSVNNKPDGTPYKMVGIPDGLGAFDNGDGTFTLLLTLSGKTATEILLTELD
jgi:hypothetical protein